ncbi:MAG TPA: hypothetical protein VM600_05975, partial [Actinomycetota bacterium]|nr:hypothetical protein [Actinomycetota bacterium]
LPSEEIAGSVMPAISSDGKWVAFSSWASNLVVGDSNYARDEDVAEVATGRIKRLSLNSAGQQAANQQSTEAADSSEPSISADGRFVAFRSGADNLVAIPAGQRDNGVSDVFVRDRDTDRDGIYDEAGASRTFIVSVGPGRRQGTGASFSPQISLDGSFVVFASEASDLVYANDPAGVLPPEGELVPVDENEFPDVYLRDIVREITTLVSSTATGEAADGPSHSPALSGDSSVVAFYSEAPNLTPDPLQSRGNIFVRDLAGQHIEVVSVASNGVSGNSPSYAPTISGDGIYVAFHSYASNFVPDQNGSSDVFYHQRNVCSTGDPEAGVVSRPVNDEVEPRAGPASSTVHDFNCSIFVPSGL